MSSVFEIAGKAARIVITIHGYERTEPTNTSDANWLNCTITASVAGFTGSVESSLTTQDLQRLHDAMQTLLETLSGRLEFRPDEEAITFDVEIGRSGSIVVAGQIKTRVDADVALTFQIESDQSYFQSTFRQLAELCRRFPPRTL